MLDPFPMIERKLQQFGSEDANPGIQLFGRRFFADQTIPELLVEFLLVSNSQKRIGENITTAQTIFPDMSVLHHWSTENLEYAPKSRLNLKLFAFLGASKLETRHRTHRQHYQDLLHQLKEKIIVSGNASKEDVLKTLENLFLGFQRVGGQRTWCAQSFLPFCPELLASETIWNSTKKNKAVSWINTVEKFNYFFTSNQHRFLARGGELLYLQLCNLFKQPPEVIKSWCEECNASFTSEEQIPLSLARSLADGLRTILTDGPPTVGELATFIDNDLDQETAQNTDYREGIPRFIKCGWCPQETWPESLFFAVELNRLCQANIDPVERLLLMETACAMQVLRTLCAQSSRYVEPDNELRTGAGPLGYVWAFSDPEGKNEILKKISRRNVNAIQRLIQKAIRHETIQKNLGAQKRQAGISYKDPYPEADRRYGYKLFLTLAKRLSLIIPRRGAGARFVLNDHLLKYLVLTTIRPGERITYDTFKNQVFLHFGMAFDEQRLQDACGWYGVNHLTSIGNNPDSWLLDVLNKAGMLIHLSDSCSMVQNPFN